MVRLHWITTAFPLLEPPDHQVIASFRLAVLYSTPATQLKGSPMHISQVNTSELAILSRVLEPEKPSLSAAAARGILDLGFNRADQERMHQLSAKAQGGTLSRREQAELNNFERVGHLIGLLQSKARRSLKDRNGKNKIH
jgi:hypothetical protein